MCFQCVTELEEDFYSLQNNARPRTIQNTRFLRLNITTHQWVQISILSNIYEISLDDDCEVCNFGRTNSCTSTTLWWYPLRIDTSIHQYARAMARNYMAKRWQYAFLNTNEHPPPSYPYTLTTFTRARIHTRYKSNRTTFS